MVLVMMMSIRIMMNFFNVGPCLSPRSLMFPCSTLISIKHFVRPSLLSPTCLVTSMPSESKAELIAKLQELGEDVPSHWTVMQMRARLSEVKALNKAQGRNILQEKMAVLNKAAKKKTHLQDLATQLHVPFTTHMTIAQLYAKMEEKITMETEAQALDKVNFGKLASATYQDILTTHRDYGKWVMDTNAESSDPHWRLQRLAQWLQTHWDAKTEKVATSRKPPPASPPRSSPSLKMCPRSPGDLTDSSFEMASTSELEISRLRQEIDTLKAENAALSLQTERTKSRKEM